MKPTHTTLARILTLAFALAPAAACGPEKPSKVVMYVGEVTGTDAVVGIAVKDDELVIGYVCGGPTTISDLTSWVSGPLNGTAFEAERGGDAVIGTFDASGDTISGVVDVDETDRPFTATRVPDGSAGGLYGAGLDDRDCLTGVVVIDGPSQRVQGASTCGAQLDEFNQVTPTAVPEPEGFDVAITGWSQSVFVRQVERAPRY